MNRHPVMAMNAPSTSTTAAQCERLLASALTSAVPAVVIARAPSTIAVYGSTSRRTLT